MTDIKTAEERSKNMSRIRSKNTLPEEYIRKKLYNRGYRYRKNTSLVAGHPDAWFPKFNTAVFVNGCYWHRHKECKYAYFPKSNVDFWNTKFEKNIERDNKIKRKLQEDGVKILIIWECCIKQMIKSEKKEEEILTQVDEFLNSKKKYLEL